MLPLFAVTTVVPGVVVLELALSYTPYAVMDLFKEIPEPDVPLLVTLMLLPCTLNNDKVPDVLLARFAPLPMDISTGPNAVLFALPTSPLMVMTAVPVDREALTPVEMSYGLLALIVIAPPLVLLMWLLDVIDLPACNVTLPLTELFSIALVALVMSSIASNDTAAPEVTLPSVVIPAMLTLPVLAWIKTLPLAAMFAALEMLEVPSVWPSLMIVTFPPVSEVLL